MKKISYYALALTMVCFGCLFVGCGNSGNSDNSDNSDNSKSAKEQYEKLGNIYRFSVDDRIKCVKIGNRAIEEGDYPTAYKIVDIMFAAGGDMYEAAAELNEKTLKNEIAAIIEENEDNSAPKILFTIKERGKYNTDNSADEKDVKEEEKKMFEYAIGLATTMGYKQAANLLQNALDQYANDDENDGDDDEEE